MICDTPFFVKSKEGSVPVPCGKCPACKTNRVSGWVFRLLEEEKVSLSSHFVTLTYDTRHVPITPNGFMSLARRDFQLFMKRLRNLCGSKLRYYAVGEYGTNNGRPHYHAIVFNVDDTSKFDQAWQLGAVHVGKVSGDSIAYTMKYIDKASFKKKHSRDDREPEFPLMSKGLGSSYLSSSILAYHKADITRTYVVRPGGFKIGLPRYYRDKIYTEDERKRQSDLMSRISQDRELFLYREFESLYSDSDDIDYLAWRESKRMGRYDRFYSSQKPRDL